MSAPAPVTFGERMSTAAYLVGWRLVRALPERMAYATFVLIADVVWRRRGSGVRRLEANLARVVPDLDHEAARQLSREAVRSYLRYWCDAFRLPGWSTERVVSTCRVENDGTVRAHLAAGRGVVAALSHQGNWDHAGAWSNHALAPVTTVAERLRPEALYERFVQYRESLGMTILPLTGADVDVFATLSSELRGGGFVPLLSDRDLTSNGVEVTFFGEPARMAAGPAALAVAGVAALFAVSVRYERLPDSGSGWGIVITFSDEIVPPATGTRDERVAAATQHCADALARGIAAAPQDWHMLQRVFTADLEPRG